MEWIGEIDRGARPLTRVRRALFQIVLSAAIITSLIAPFWPVP